MRNQKHYSNMSKTLQWENNMSDSMKTTWTGKTAGKQHLRNMWTKTTVGKQLATEQGLLSITASTGQHGDPPHCRDKLADNFCQMPSQTPSTMAPFTMSYLWIKKFSIRMYSGIAGIITINVSSQKNFRY